LGRADVISRRGTLTEIWHHKDRTSRIMGSFVNTCHFQVTIAISKGISIAITKGILEGDRSWLRLAQLAKNVESIMEMHHAVLAPENVIIADNLAI
ncbi:hypothetical protein PIB30_110776, partial [Stylosanthes scabra]|nr:hypothetical protein [Stylosanthes scabra]